MIHSLDNDLLTPTGQMAARNLATIAITPNINSERRDDLHALPNLSLTARQEEGEGPLRGALYIRIALREQATSTGSLGPK